MINCFNDSRLENKIVMASQFGGKSLCSRKKAKRLFKKLPTFRHVLLNISFRPRCQGKLFSHKQANLSNPMAFVLAPLLLRMQNKRCRAKSPWNVIKRCETCISGFRRSCNTKRYRKLYGSNLVWRILPVMVV